MIPSCFRTYFALACLALFPSAVARADNFTGSTYFNFEGRGFASYDLSFSAKVVVNGTSFASAYAGFGGFSGSSSGVGHAEVGMQLSNIHKGIGQWVAENITVYVFNGSTGQYQYTYYNNYPLLPAITVFGNAQCNGVNQPVNGTIVGHSGPPNNPPVPTISITGLNSGASVSLNTTVTVNFGATDPDNNLSGVRYNISNSAGYFDNGGGNFVAQPGAGGVMAKSVLLSSPGTWYFWTDAQDAMGAVASTAGGTSAYSLTVTAGSTWCTPAYEPAYWNNDSTTLNNNNCYNYSNNRRTDTFAQPGRASGHLFASLSGSDVSTAAVADGLEPTTAAAVSPTGKTKIALVIWPGWDYHWYRQDSDGRWSHKPGSTPARNTDDSGAIITNPETANRGPYTQFIGYFFTPSDCIQGQGHANIL